MAEPTLIAAGRASEIFDLGDGRVLRRFKAGGDPEREALVMRHVRAHGYPAPEVLEIGPGWLVLERIEGETMFDAIASEPATMGDHAARLARLHDELHAIEAPVGLPAAGEGDRAVHLDLHPANVILSPSGPVVIDWANARRGEPLLDVAFTWLICATSSGVGRLGTEFADRFLACFDRDEVFRQLPLAAERRLADPNVLDEERDRIRALAAHAGGSG
ncbi:MAG TPA: phosphotransferase [Gaiellaceae bacterium]|nr:phosphotransferase [Gaiellaceae bacterium]